MTWRGVTADQIRVCELVNEKDTGAARQRGIEVQLLTDDASIFDGQCRETDKALEQALGLYATVRLDVPDDHVSAGCCASTVRSFQHCVGLSNARSGTKKDAQPAALRAGLLGLDVS
jgi:hypothetical protein